MESGLVPNIDSGKKTFRFKIKTSDVIQYLKDRDDYPELYKAPDGFYKMSSCKKAPSFDKVFTKKDLIHMRQYFETLLENEPDIMTVGQVAQFTGYCKNSVSRWCGKKELKSFLIKQRFRIPKEYLLDFLVSKYFIGIAVKSAKHKIFNQEIHKMCENINSSNGKNVNFTNAETIKRYKTWKEDIDVKIKTWYEKPSFDYSKSQKSIEIKSGEKKVVTDNSGVFEDYEPFYYYKDGIKVTHEAKSNELLVQADMNCTKETVTMTSADLVKAGGIKYTTDAVGNYVYSTPKAQDMCVYGFVDPIFLTLKFNVDISGEIHIKKTSEDGVVSGIKFNISGNGVNKTVTTGADGTIDVGLMPGVYNITEQSIDRYEPQSVQRVTIISGKTSTVTFNNVLKSGGLEVVKSSDDNMAEGVKFHLYGTSLSGLPVDEYAVTDKNGIAKFENVLISGDTPYVVEEVDTAIRYVVPESQTAPIEWEKVTSRSFTNILKKFNVTVTKSDVETGTAQGDASLAGAVYGIYKEEELTEKTNRLNILNGLLNVDKRENELVDGMPDNDYEILKFKNKEHER